MAKNKILNAMSFILVGLIGGMILIIISELVKLTHTNFIPFGGHSWAIWFYPVMVGISFGISSKLFKINKPILIFFHSNDS